MMALTLFPSVWYLPLHDIAPDVKTRIILARAQSNSHAALFFDDHAHKVPIIAAIQVMDWACKT